MNRYMLCFTAPILLAFLTTPLLAVDRCATFDLDPKPKWISTVERNPASGELLIADPKNRSLLAYDTKVNKMSEVRLSGEIPPASVTKVQGGFLIKYRDDASIIGLDKKPIMTVNLRNTKAGGPTGLGSLYSNWITRGSTFVGYGSVVRADLTTQEYNPARGFQLGFVRGTVTASSGQFRNIELLEPTEDNNFYSLGFPYFAANDDGIFYVRMAGDQSSIVRVNENAVGDAAREPIRAFPEGFRTIHKLKTENVGPSSTAARYAEIEKSTMVVGLFGQGKFIYALTRRPDGEKTEWSLFQIDPKNPKTTGEVRLPTTAHHLSVVPGPDYWYLFERGEVKGWGDQRIDTLVRIPRAWIAEPAASPLNAESPAVLTCSK
jgi:hypothetical protein